jgi:hypothetical protein
MKIIMDRDLCDASRSFCARTSGRTLEFDLTDEVQEGLALEGWEFLADFYPSYLRTGAAERWRKLAPPSA